MKKIKKWFKRYWLRLRWIPFADAPVDEWRFFAQNAPRWLVEEVASTWFDDFDETDYWSEVNEILKERCFHFERPVLSSSFIEMNSDRICFVKENSASEMITTLVKNVGKKYPFFVVEQKTNKMLGIALNEKLVIAGVINGNFLSGNALDILRQNSVYFLSSQDVEWFPCFQKELSLMLSEVGLEPLDEWYWYYKGMGLPEAWNTNMQWIDPVKSTASIIGKF